MLGRLTFLPMIPNFLLSKCIHKAKSHLFLIEFAYILQSKVELSLIDLEIKIVLGK